MLKSLEMFGFKSFAERTRFDLSPGITCVVGPNGSGKSNVVDAIKWLLGDQSPKSLRGKEMTDVIFNGSKGCKPSGFAEAILTFDNSSDLLDIDSDEVQIGRRLYRSGDSEYIINNNVVRLKDIRDLLAGTGAGLSAYNIIEQGRVGQILQGNASSRRIIFEEAAGISRYKTRKVEAGRKLDRVSQNLLRLTDIVDEVSSQLNATRNQASKAAKYREVSVELKQWWFGLAADDYSRLSQRLEEVETQSATVNKKWDECQGQHEVYEKQRKQFDEELEIRDHAARETEKKLASIREKQAERQATVRFQLDRQEELNDELLRLQKQKMELSDRVESIHNELTTAQTEFQETEATVKADQALVEQHEATLNKFESRLASLQEKLQETTASIDATNKKITQQKDDITHIKAQRETVLSAIERAQAELDNATQQVEAAQVEREEHRAIYKDAVSHFSRGEVELTNLQKQIKETEKKREDLRTALHQLREDRSASQARLHVLQDLEQKQEGMTIGVREILQRAQSSNQSPWNQVQGMVADLIEVDFENAALLDVALADRAQWIVVNSLDPFLTYLDEELPRFAGRVGFWEWNQNVLVTQQASLKNQPDLTARPGVMGKAERLCTGNDPAKKALAQRLLFETWIVDSLETAVELSREFPGQFRYVTLQGELISDAGSLVVGTAQGESSLVSRRSEIRRLKADLISLDEQILDNEKVAASIIEHLKTCQQNWNEANEKLQNGSDQLADLRAAVTGHDKTCTRLAKEQTRHAADLKKMLEHSEALQTQFMQCQNNLKTIDEQQADLQNQKQKLIEEEKELRNQRAESSQQISELKLELARDNQRLKNHTDIVTRLRNEQKQRTQQQQEASRRLNLSQERIQKTALLLMNLRSEMDDLLIQDEDFTSKSSQFTQGREQLQQERAKISSLEIEFRNYRRELQDEQHRLEISGRDMQHELSVLQERIEDEYQMTLDEVAQQGVSAYQMYLEEMNPPKELSIETEDDLEEEIEPKNETAHHEHVDEEPIISYEEARPEIEARVNKMRRKMKSLGNVNTDALESLDELEQRHQHMNGQLQDLIEAKTALEQIIRRIDSEMKRLFVETYDSIRGHFKDLFRKMFGGGEGDVILEDPEDVLECGLEIIARPPGKELRSLGLLSGGEKTMTAVALLMAMFRSRPSPFCILDEVDAALDEANIDRYITVLREFKDQTQFVMITHRKRSMTVADTLYGVTMEQAGISKRLVVQFDDIAEDGQFTTNSKAAA